MWWLALLLVAERLLLAGMKRKIRINLKVIKKIRREKGSEYVNE